MMFAKRGNPRLGRKVLVSTLGEPVEAFVPPPLPPDPPVRVEGFYDLLEAANRAIGRLEGIGSVFSGDKLFLYTYIRKEALLSSQIEGTQSSLSELLRYENADVPGAPINADVQEVSNYVDAMHHGLERLRGGLPVSVRLIREVHQKLMRQGRGEMAAPGEFRRKQNWVGGTRPGNSYFVPPPPEQVVELMSDLEKLIHAPTPTIPFLVKVGLVHVQFETIHPFLDGNGRLGRLLITLLLCARDILSEPLLYLSLYFKAHRDEYYARLQAVRTHGDWETWLHFFLAGVIETSRQAADTAVELLRLFDADRQRIETLGRPAASALRVHQLLQEMPLVSIPRTARQLSISPPTVAKSIAHLEKLGIVQEATGRQRGRIFAYRAYLSVLERGAEPLSS